MAREFPLSVATRHYLRVTGRHFEQAVGGAPGGANQPEVVQNKTGQGRTNRDRQPMQISKEPSVFIQKNQ